VKNVKEEELGVVVLSAEFLVNILALDQHIIRPNHGIKSLQIHFLYFDSMRSAVCALISSPDIPVRTGGREILSHDRIELSVFGISRNRYS
jgi:hypothetical protein